MKIYKYKLTLYEKNDSQKYGKSLEIYTFNTIYLISLPFFVEEKGATN
jgi:hypothetical protein